MALEAFEKYKKKFKFIPNPEESEKGKKNFEKNIKKTFKEVLPQNILDTLTQNKCGLCKQNFSCQLEAHSHYTGYQHKGVIKAYLKGSLRQHPPFFKMVYEALVNAYPESLTEKSISEYIIMKYDVDDLKTTRFGIERLYENDYIKKSSDGYVCIDSKIVLEHIGPRGEVGACRKTSLKGEVSSMQTPNPARSLVTPPLKPSRIITTRPRRSVQHVMYINQGHNLITPGVDETSVGVGEDGVKQHFLITDQGSSLVTPPLKPFSIITTRPRRSVQNSMIVDQGDCLAMPGVVETRNGVGEDVVEQHFLITDQGTSPVSLPVKKSMIITTRPSRSTHSDMGKLLNGERKFPCENCGIMFSSLSNKERHRREHCHKIMLQYEKREQVVEIKKKVVEALTGKGRDTGGEGTPVWREKLSPRFWELRRLFKSKINTFRKFHYKGHQKTHVGAGIKEEQYEEYDEDIYSPVLPH